MYHTLLRWNVGRSGRRWKTGMVLVEEQVGTMVAKGRRPEELAARCGGCEPRNRCTSFLASERVAKLAGLAGRDLAREVS